MPLRPKSEVLVTGRTEGGKPWALYGVVCAIHDQAVMVKTEDGAAQWYDRAHVSERERNTASQYLDTKYQRDEGDENSEQLVMLGECSDCGGQIIACEEDHLVYRGLLYCFMCMQRYLSL